MIKHNKQKSPKTLSGIGAKNQNPKESKGKQDFTTKQMRVLNWIYQQTIKGKTATAFDSFNKNQDTAFRTHISELGYKYSLDIPREWVKKPNTGVRYKKYWLSENDIKKVQKILNLG